MLLLGVLQAQAAGAVGSFDLLETQVLDSAESSVTFSSLSAYAADYRHLQIRFAARTAQSGTSRAMRVRMNGVSTSSYSLHLLDGNGSAVNSGAGASQTFIYARQIAASSAAANIFGAGVIDFLDPFSSSKNTTIRSLGGIPGVTSDFVSLASGAYYSTDAITSIELYSENGSSNFVTDSRFSLYGIKGSA